MKIISTVLVTCFILGTVLKIQTFLVKEEVSPSGDYTLKLYYTNYVIIYVKKLTLIENNGIIQREIELLDVPGRESFGWIDDTLFSVHNTTYEVQDFF